MDPSGVVVPPGVVLGGAVVPGGAVVVETLPSGAVAAGEQAGAQNIAAAASAVTHRDVAGSIIYRAFRAGFSVAGASEASGRLPVKRGPPCPVCVR